MTKTKVILKGAIDNLKQSLADIEAETKENSDKLNLHGKLSGELICQSIFLSALRKQCLDTIALLEKTARAQGEEV